MIAFFIIPPAAAYLLTDRLPRMLLYSSLIGAAGAYFGYDLARGSFLGVVQVSDMLAGLNRLFNLGLIEQWDSSISASMVLMIFFFFLVSWIFSPKYGLVSTLLRRSNQRRHFDYQVVLSHVYNHRGRIEEREELRASTLYQHFRWSPTKNAARARPSCARSASSTSRPTASPSPRAAEKRVLAFRQTQLANQSARE